MKTPTYHDVERTCRPYDNDLPAPAILLDWVRSHLHSRTTRPELVRFPNKISFPIVLSALPRLDIRQIITS